MGYGIKLLVSGEYACFTRPEMKVERVSYDVMTPSAARGILTSISWKPAIDWRVDRIIVQNQIKFTSIRRNEINDKVSESKVLSAMEGKEEDLHQYAASERQQRATLMLRDVAYVIEAHFILTNEAGKDDTPEKHYNIFLRRARNGSYHHTPCLGLRELPAKFRLLDEGGFPLNSYYHDQDEVDLGYMLHSIDYDNNMQPLFFRAYMRKGIIHIPVEATL